MFAPAALFVVASAVSAPTTTELEAMLDVGDGAVSGKVRITVENVTDDPLDHAYVWLFANRLAARPRALNDVNFHWVYPLEFDAGWTRLRSVRVGGKDVRARVVPHAVAGADTLVAITLPSPVAPGGRVAVDLTFETKVPDRFGGFGCTGDGCVLGGGFYPMAATLDAAGWDLSAPPAWGRVTGTLALSSPGAVATGDGVASGSVAKLDLRGPYAAVVAADRLHETTREHAGVKLTWIGRRGPPASDDAGKQLLPYTEEDYGAMVLAAAAEAVDLLAEIGAPVPAGTRLVLVEAPLRQELAQAQPGMVLVSDRIFRIFPIDRFRKFHQRELVRALYSEWLARRGGTLPPRERDAAAEAGAAYLLDLYTIRQWRKHELARDLLSPVSFVPAIDQLLYAPQVAFAGAYFGSIADEDRFRDDPRRFAHDRPRGFVYYEKLRDLVAAETFGDAMRGVVVDGLSVRAAAERASKRELGWFFRQWGRAYPRVNYAIGPRRKAREGGGWKHTVTVLKEAPPGETPPVEPVEVRVVDGGGKRHALTWDGAGERGELAFVSASGSIKSIDLDPRRRLVESGASESSDDPRFDDRTPPRLKFLYNGFGALLSFSDLSLGLLWDFSFRRVHDTRNDLRVTLYSGGSVTFGGSVGYSRHLGKNVTPLRRSSSIGVSLALSRLDGDYAGSPSDGTRLSISAGVSTDDRLWAFMPGTARGASLVARYSITRFDGGDSDLLQTGSLYADVTRIFTPADGHTFVAYLEGAVVAGDIRARSQLLAAGGSGVLRGYLSTELFGRARTTGHLEWRGTIRHDLSTNIGHWIVLRGLGAAVFTDVGAISSCDGYTDLFASQNLYANVGFGLRLFYDNLGVQQGMMALDLAVPLALRPRKCLTETATMELSRPPFMVYLSFVPPF